MVGASSGRLDYIRCLEFSRGRGMKVNIGEQRVFRLSSCTGNRSRCCHLSGDVCRDNVT